MPKYACLLRGINVGGNNIIKMKDLQAAFEQAGFDNVPTYIQSGNVVFESSGKNTKNLTLQIEKLLKSKFKYDARVLVLNHKQLKDILAKMPREWQKPDELRCNIAYLMPPLTAAQAVKEFEPREGVDSVKMGPSAVYITTPMKLRVKSGLPKIVSKPVYKEMTIRNLNTSNKLLEMMNE